jgi:CheY-like chemotaxis protein
MKQKILAVDDSKAIRFLLQTIFAKKYEVITAADASSATYWLSRKNFPDLIISETSLPDVNEWEFISNLKNSFLFKDIPVIVLSSFAKNEVQKQCSKYEIKHFFTKPFNPVEIMETVDGLLFNEEKIS